MANKRENKMKIDAKLTGLKAEAFMGRAFLRKEIAPLLGLTGRSIQGYTDLGIVVPQISNPSGKGSKRLYSTKNIFELLLLQLVIKNGIKLSDCKPIIVKATEGWVKSPSSRTLVIYTPKELNSEYDIRLFEQDHLNLKIDTKKFESILILDLSDIIKKIKTL